MTQLSPVDSRPILIVLQSDLYVRNFIQSKAFGALLKNHPCLLAHTENVTIDLRTSGFPVAGVIHLSPRRIRLSVFLMYLTMMAYRDRSPTFQIKFDIDIGFRKLRWLYQVLGLPGIRWFSTRALCALLGKNPSLELILDTVKPSMVLVPAQGTDLVATDVITSARHHGIPSFVLVNGWDNMSSKGVMVHLPDFLGVWGEKARQDALHIHRISDQRVHILGAPHFEVYRRPAPPEAVQQILDWHGVAPQKRLIVFGGSSRDVAEVALLNLLEESMEKNTLTQVHVLYRPHPWGHTKDIEKRFLDRGYRHITLDHQISQRYQEQSATSGGTVGSRFLHAALDYYPALLSAAACVISPLSTLLIEAALVGKPGLAIAFSTGPSEFPPEKMLLCEHNRYLLQTRAMLTCHTFESFIPDVQRLLLLANQSGIQRTLRSDIEHVVSFDATSYPERLSAAVDNILA